MKGLGMGGLVDKLLKCGITLADYHSLAVEDEDGDSQEMGFEDYDSMVRGRVMAWWGPWQSDQELSWEF